MNLSISFRKPLPPLDLQTPEQVVKGVKRDIQGVLFRSYCAGAVTFLGAGVIKTVAETHAQHGMSDALALGFEAALGGACLVAACKLGARAIGRIKEVTSHRKGLGPDGPIAHDSARAAAWLKAGGIFAAAVPFSIFLLPGFLSPDLSLATLLDSFNASFYAACGGTAVALATCDIAAEGNLVSARKMLRGELVYADDGSRINTDRAA